MWRIIQCMYAVHHFHCWAQFRIFIYLSAFYASIWPVIIQAHTRKHTDISTTLTTTTKIDTVNFAVCVVVCNVDAKSISWAWFFCTFTNSCGRTPAWFSAVNQARTATRISSLTGQRCNSTNYSKNIAVGNVSITQQQMRARLNWRKLVNCTEKKAAKEHISYDGQFWTLLKGIWHAGARKRASCVS